jgi:hypothetical protein
MSCGVSAHFLLHLPLSLPLHRLLHLLLFQTHYPMKNVYVWRTTRKNSEMKMWTKKKREKKEEN